MAIVKWDPFRWPGRSLWDWPDVWDEELPMVVDRGLDVYETEDSVVVKASVAGVDPAKVEVTFEKGVLWIRAAEEEEERKGKKYYSKTSRSYNYKVAVPGNIDVSREPTAEVENGVVNVTFAKAEEAKPKKIAVRKKGK